MAKLPPALLIPVAAAVFAAPALHSQTTAINYLIVARSQNPSTTAAVAAAASARGTVIAQLDAIGVVAASSADPDFAAAVTANANVQGVAPDHEIQWLSPAERAVEATMVTPGAESLNAEPFTRYQWNLRQIQADRTAAAGYLGRGARIAVLDSGIVSSHPDIAPNLNLELSRSFVTAAGEDPAEDLDPPANTFNHGTHVAGIIAAPINGNGIQGVAPAAEIVAIKVLRADGRGSFAWLVQGLEYAASIHADVANMSLGVTFDRNNAGGANGPGGAVGPLMAALNRAIDHATRAGVLCVSAAGNDGVSLDGRLVSIPAQSGNGMAVSATGPIGQADFDRLASYSNFGRSVIDVAAPGGDAMLFPRPTYIYDMVMSPGGYAVSDETGVSYKYFFAEGTSMAAPHVSGVAALIVGKYGHIGPAAIRTILQSSADDILKPGADAQSGRGRINAWQALQ